MTENDELGGKATPATAIAVAAFCASILALSIAVAALLTVIAGIHQ